MKTYCLVIDDDNQEEYFETEVRRVLLKNHIDITPIFIKTTDQYKYMKADHTGFDKSFIERDCINAIKDFNCSVVVSDYQIVTKADGFTGLDILNTISDHYPHLFKVLYSGGQIHNAIKRMYDVLSGEMPPKGAKMSGAQIVGTIKQLDKIACINRLIKGKGFAETIVKYIQSSPLILQQQLLYQMKVDYRDMTFKSCYPTLRGWKLKDIGEQIEKKTPQGCDFQQALIEQVLSYLIEINQE